jgi:hypothetical protein
VYEQKINRATPGCLIILLDRSDSMRERAPNGASLAAGAAEAVNRLLFNLAKRSQKERGAAPRYYFDIGVLGYGRASDGRGEAVEVAFQGALAGRPLVALPDLASNPIRIDQVRTNVDLPPTRLPIWVDPAHGFGTPMCQALSAAGYYAAEWIKLHPTSFPPVVLNITDGVVTDSPYEGTDLAGWAGRVRALTTEDGNALLYNIFLSVKSGATEYFPDRPDQLPAPGPTLFEISSELPPYAVTAAQNKGYTIHPGARGLVFNAGLDNLAELLDLGTPQQARED